MNTIENARSRRSPINKFSSCACTDTSSPDTISSAIRIFGAAQSARAMLTRWRWPPESCEGNRDTASGGNPISASSARARSSRSCPAHRAVGFERLRDDAADAAARIERRLRILKDQLRVVPMRFRSEIVHDLMISKSNAARGRLLEPDQQARHGRLAAAAFADDGDEFICRERKADIAHRGEAFAVEHVAEREGLAQRLDLQHRRARSRLPGLGQRRRRDPRRQLRANARRRVSWLTVTNGGGAALQAATTLGQRGANAQPLMSLYARKARHALGQSRERAPGAAHRRVRQLQAAGIGMRRGGEHGARRAVFGRTAGVEHQNVVADLRGEPQVVGDEQHGGAVALLHLGDQANDAGLNGDVERGRRLVRDHQARLAGKRHGDQHALAHAAGDLMRILAQQPLPARQMHGLEQVERAPAPLAGRCRNRAVADARRSAGRWSAPG